VGWGQSAPAWSSFQTEYDRAVELSRQFDQIGIPDPHSIKEAIEVSRGDHYRSQTQILRMIQTEEVLEGGDSRTQAAGLDETSSSLEEMPSMTKHNADNAQQANALASEDRKAADTGAESMTRVSQAINDIQRSSGEHRIPLDDSEGLDSFNA
jgi:transglutaminase/protease-like cytokinesis protein 3